MACCNSFHFIKETSFSPARTCGSALNSEKTKTKNNQNILFSFTRLMLVFPGREPEPAVMKWNASKLYTASRSSQRQTTAVNEPNHHCPLFLLIPNQNANQTGFFFFFRNLNQNKQGFYHKLAHGLQVNLTVRNSSLLLSCHPVANSLLTVASSLWPTNNHTNFIYITAT